MFLICVRIAKGQAPPGTLTEKWPKDLSASIALHGNQAKLAGKPSLRFEALTQSGLVTRSLMLASAEKPDAEVEVVDSPRTVVVEGDTPCGSSRPPGTTADGRTPTWNARVRLRKYVPI